MSLRKSQVCMKSQHWKIDVLAKTPCLYLVPELRYPCHCCRHPSRCPPPRRHRHHHHYLRWWGNTKRRSSRKPQVSIKSQSWEIYDRKIVDRPTDRPTDRPIDRPGNLYYPLVADKNEQGIVNFIFCPVPSCPCDQPTCTAVSFAQANKIRKSLFLYF